MAPPLQESVSVALVPRRRLARSRVQHARLFGHVAFAQRLLDLVAPEVLEPAISRTPGAHAPAPGSQQLQKGESVCLRHYQRPTEIEDPSEGGMVPGKAACRSGTADSPKSERPDRACSHVPRGLTCPAAGRDSRAGHGADRLQAARAGRASEQWREGGEAGAPGGDLEAEIYKTIGGWQLHPSSVAASQAPAGAGRRGAQRRRKNPRSARPTPAAR